LSLADQQIWKHTAGRAAGGQ